MTTIICENCETVMDEDEAVYTYDGCTLCQECYDELYRECHDCGEVCRLSDMRHVRDFEVCVSCYSEYYICSGCGYHFRARDLQTIDGTSYCYECAIEDICCESCGEYIQRNEAHYINCRAYCDNCYNEQSLPICNYHSFNNYRTLETNKDPDNCLTLGFELEVSGSRRKATEFLKHFEENEIVLMNDSSIIGEGFEIITMPMTLNYLKQEFLPRLKEGMRFLRDNGFQSHNKGGMHIHVSDDYISNSMLANIRDIMYGSDNDINTWLAITQRKKDTMERWSSMNNGCCSYSTIKNRRHKQALGSTRYTAVNYSNRTKTYEFRIFNGNLRIERILKNIQCVLALIDYAKIYRGSDIPLCNTEGFLKYVIAKKRKYKELAGFIKERNIMLNHLRKRFEEAFDYEETEAA